MIADLIAVIALLFIILTLIEVVFVLDVMDDPDGFAFFNPIRNYKTWTSMNWFGVIFVTLMLNVIMPLYAIGYWFYKLCTVGRK